jgi:hypothetical protein
METTLLKETIQYKFQREMKKMDIQFLIPKTMIKVTKELSDAHQKTFNEAILEQITEKFMEKILHTVNQNV